jgi:hypothetical protein
MAGRPADPRTEEREAYFLELATMLAATSPLPLMLIGGISGAGNLAKARVASCAR